jgi:all-trans-retinol 13,14-reductase
MTSDRTYDTVVGGAGLGGLVAGAKLATAGQHVLVLEQHSVPGGCATTFDRREFEFEVSLHEIDGFDENDVKRDILRELGVLDDLSFERIPEFYRYRRGGRDVVVPHERAAACEKLTEEFPNETDGVRRFYDVIVEIRESLLDFAGASDPSLPSLVSFALRNRTFVRHRNESLGEFLDDLFDADAPKRVLTANLGYYHDDPYSLSLPWFAVSQGGYVSSGGYYLKGGSQRLANSLAATIERAGGAVETGRRVTDVLVEDGVATGVRHEHSRAGTPETTGTDTRVETADAVVANAAVPLVANELLPSRHGKRLAAQFEDWDIAPSLTTLYLGFETRPSELGVDHYSTVIQHECVETLADVASVQRDSYGRRTLTFVDYSQVDAALAPEEKSVGVVSTVDYLDEWTGLTDAEYRRKKARVTEVFRRRLEAQYPRLSGAVKHAELATPKTIQRYTLNPGGTAYGFAQTPSQSLFDRQVESPLPNLHFASAWTFPGGGFTGAIMSGYLTAETLLAGDASN